MNLSTFLEFTGLLFFTNAIFFCCSALAPVSSLTTENVRKSLPIFSLDSFSNSCACSNLALALSTTFCCAAITASSAFLFVRRSNSFSSCFKTLVSSSTLPIVALFDFTVSAAFSFKVFIFI